MPFFALTPAPRCCIAGEEESSDEEVTHHRRGVSLKDFKSRLERQDSFGLDNPNFQNIFRSVGGGAAGCCEDDPSVFSDIQLNGDRDVLDLAPSHSSSASPVKEKPRKSTKKKSKKSKSDRSALADIDQNRPDSDKAAFERLQVAKAQLRKQKFHFPPGGKHFATDNTMVCTTHQNPDADAEETEATTQNIATNPSARRREPDNSPPNGQENASTSRIPSKRKADFSAEVILDVKSQIEVEEIWARDKKLPADKRAKRIYELITDKYGEREKFNKTIAKYKAKLLKVESERNDLQKTLAETEQTSQSAAITLKINQEILKACKEIAKTKLWRHRKFVPDSDAEVTAAEFVLSKIDVLKNDMKNPDTKASLIKTYKTEIKKALFGQKNYVSSEIKKIVWKMFEEHKSIPTVEEILKCATRKIETNSDMELFALYWETILPRMVGAKEWDTGVRWYKTISAARDPDDPKDRLITVSDEAMLVLIWDNCFERWKIEWEWEKEKEKVQDDTTTKKNKPKWPGKFSMSNTGQCKWGGWKREAYIEFNTYFQAIKAGRKDKNCKKVEQNCLQVIRRKHMITEENAELQESISRRRKRAEKKGETLEVGVPIPAEQRNIQPFVEIDSDEDGLNEAMDDDSDEN